MPTPPASQTQIFIAGMSASVLVRIANLVITDVINEQPNTATLTVNQTPHAPATAAFAPHAFDAAAFVTTPVPMIYPAIRRGQPIAIYAGSQNADSLVFAGEIVSTRQFYDVQRPALVGYHLSCIDYTRALNRRKVMHSYGTQSVTAIVLDLMASRIAEGFTTRHVAPNLPPVAIDFTFEEMNRALTRLANRIGAYWYIDYEKDLHFFLEEPGDAPAPLVPGGEPFADLTFDTDLSQVRTRVLVEGAGSVTLAQVLPGETMIPVQDPIMFPPTGLVVIGQQRLAYTSVVTGGAGSLIGPGAQPGSAPVATPTPGTGIESGVHAYAVTFQSASGESLPSPTSAPVTLGAVDPPAGAPAAGAPTAGSGPDPGVHYYAVSFVTASGETPPSGYSGPTETTQVSGVPAPSATTAVKRGVIGNLQTGVSYRYKTTFTTATGQTLPGPPSTAFTPTGPPPPPPVIANFYPGTGGALTAGGTYLYWLSYIAPGYETALRAAHTLVPLTASQNAVDLQNIPDLNFADPRMTGRRLYRSKAGETTPARLLVTINDMTTTAYFDTTADASLGATRLPNDPPIGTIGDQATVTIPSSGDTRVTGRKIYRSDAAAPFRFLATISNNTATQHVDNTASVSTQPDAPTTDTTGGALTCVVPLAGILTGPAGVTARKLYRTPVGSIDLKLLATLANNTATTYTDTKLDAALGALAPTGNTTAQNQVALANLPIGGAGVTARKVYRTAAGAALVQFLTTIADNTTTTATDAASDATLGAPAPDRRYLRPATTARPGECGRDNPAGRRDGRLCAHGRLCRDWQRRAGHPLYRRHGDRADGHPAEWPRRRDVDRRLQLERHRRAGPDRDSAERDGRDRAGPGRRPGGAPPDRAGRCRGAGGAGGDRRRRRRD